VDNSAGVKSAMRDPVSELAEQLKHPDPDVHAAVSLALGRRVEAIDSKPTRATVEIPTTAASVCLTLPGGWRLPLVRFTHEGCQFVGVQTGGSLTSVWHSPKCPCGR
jgi:hypothetical protein